MNSRRPPGQSARLTAVLRPVVEAAGFELEQVSVSRVGRRSLVRVVVDADDGISLDAVAQVSRVISGALDADPTDSGAYTLEVTSPGVDRPLTEPRHWRRAVGRLVRTRLGDRAVEGRIVAADDAGVEIAMDDTVLEVPYAGLSSGSVQVEFVKGMKA